MATTRVGRSATEHGATELVARTLARHHDALRAVARRHSLCDDDAADAVQRALELFLRHADRLDPEQAHRWLFTVTKREAFSVREERQRILPRGGHDFDGEEARHEPSPDDQLLELDRVAKATEALARLKPAEAQALWLQASGRSYEDIAGDLNWTRTKVNRAITEGRARLRARMNGIETGEECERWAPVVTALRDGTADAADLTDARHHLRRCAGCRAEIRAVHRPGMLTAVPGGFMTVVVALQERAVGGAVRAQAAVEAITTGKAAAVAASAAALAGGGVVAAERAIEPPSRGQAEQVRSAPVRAAPGPARSSAAGRAPDPVAAAVLVPARTPTPTPPRAPAKAPSVPPAPAPREDPRTTAGEFGPDGSGTPSPPPADPVRRAPVPRAGEDAGFLP